MLIVALGVACNAAVHANYAFTAVLVDVSLFPSSVMAHRTRTKHQVTQALSLHSTRSVFGATGGKKGGSSSENKPEAKGKGSVSPDSPYTAPSVAVSMSEADKPDMMDLVRTTGCGVCAACSLLPCVLL